MDENTNIQIIDNTAGKNIIFEFDRPKKLLFYAILPFLGWLLILVSLLPGIPFFIDIKSLSSQESDLGFERITLDYWHSLFGEHIEFLVIELVIFLFPFLILSASVGSKKIKVVFTGFQQIKVLNGFIIFAILPSCFSVILSYFTFTSTFYELSFGAYLYMASQLYMCVTWLISIIQINKYKKEITDKEFANRPDLFERFYVGQNSTEKTESTSKVTSENYEVIAEKLSELKSLENQGLITPEEYEEKRKQYLELKR